MGEETEFSGQAAEESQQVQRTPKILWPKLNTPEWISALAAVAAALAAFAGVVVALQTRMVLDHQLSEMHSGGVDTHNLAIATQNLAGHARDQATAMDRLRRAAEAQDVDSRQQADSIRQMAIATRESAAAGEQGNNIASRAFVASERPWVGVDSIQTAAVRANQDLRITVTIRNTGHSPALRFHGNIQTDFLPPGAPLPEPTEVSNMSNSTVLPNGTTMFNPIILGAGLTKEMVDKVNAGTEFLVLYGRLDYSDDFGTKHRTFICAFYNTKAGSAFSACPGGNDAN